MGAQDSWATWIPNCRPICGLLKCLKLYICFEEGSEMSQFWLEVADGGGGGRAFTVPDY